jgi:pimeloyl-ACP methyl ester carboxylesterase
MELFYRRMGKGKPLVILHGLYGTSDNWYTIGRQLSEFREVFLLDCRNHGQSPHHPVHTYGAMRDDLHEFLVQHSLYKPVIMGHSMGGRAAMFFAVMHPKLIEKLIVVDISPCSYKADNHPNETLQHATILHALQSIDISSLSSRTDADDQLARTIQSPVIRQFMLKNLKKDSQKHFYWCLNLPALEKNLPEIFLGIDTLSLPEGFQLDFPALFIQGELSGYIGKNDLECIKRYFKDPSVITIPRASHWVHAEQPGLFVEAVRNFLGD